jgi:hypothetical protein
MALALLVAAIGAPAAQDKSLPNQPDSLKFGIVVAVQGGGEADCGAREVPLRVRPDDG